MPDNPLSAKGLATPYQLGDGCSQANPSQEAFVEATILAPNGRLSVYDPLVVTQGTTPAVAPTPPNIPRGAQVIINAGFNGNNLVLEGDGAVQGRCVDAFGNSIISQTSACNARAFYAAANPMIASGRIRVPALGTGTDGQACETTESFSLIDQDQSDNVISEYLLNGNGQTAQNTAANKNAMGGATVHRERQRRRAARALRGPGDRLHPVRRARRDQPERQGRLAGAERAQRADAPARHRARCSRSTTRSCWWPASSASVRPTPSGC